MSQNRSRNRAANRTPPRGEPPAGNRTAARDGYVNPLAKLGGASALMASGSFERSFTAAPALLTSLYRESWLAKRIIDMPSEDMTRCWYTLSLPPEEAEELKRLEAKHEIRREITNGIRWARLYGGACALMVIDGHENILDTPLDPVTIMPGSFCGLLIRDRISGVSPSGELETDLNDPDFGYPMYYDLQLDDAGPGFSGSPSSSFLRVHHSRILRFTGRDLPRSEEIGEEYWGASELEHIWEELQKRNATSANIAQLVFQANITTLRMSDFGEVLASGTEKQKMDVLSALERENELRTSFGLQLLSSGDTFENHPYSFSGLSQVYEAFMLDMAGAAGIPATRLFGRSPQGMNATGEGDMKNYCDLIAQMQENHLRPALEKLLPVMAMSLWGSVPERMDISFPSLMPVSPLEEAEVRARRVSVLTEALSAGLMTPAEARDKLKEYGIL